MILHNDVENAINEAGRIAAAGVPSDKNVSLLSQVLVACTKAICMQLEQNRRGGPER
jgi:hypothetical protein